MSCRTGAYASLERRGKDQSQHGGVFANERHLASFFDEQQKKDHPYLEIRPFDEKREGPEAYRLRAEAFPERSCGVAYDSLGEDVRALLLNPLHLHVFHETFAGRSEIAGNLDESDLLGAYLDRLCDELPALRETLERIGRYMVEHATPALPGDIADEWVNAWRQRQGYSSADRVVKLDPIEELVSASILMRPSNEGFGVD
jgi:hypothetical protein